MISMMMNDYIWTDGSELYHHGIKGQKWGVRRFQNPDGSYTDEGRRRRGIKTAASAVKDKWNGLSDKQRTAIKVGAAVAATALVAYGAYKVGAFSAVAEAGKATADKIVNSNAYTKASEFATRMSMRPLAKTVEAVEKRQNAISDETLKATKERLQLEADILKLQKEASGKSENWVKEAAKSIAKKAAVQLGTGIAVSAIVDMLNGEDVDLSKVKRPTPKDKW